MQVAINDGLSFANQRPLRATIISSHNILKSRYFGMDSPVRSPADFDAVEVVKQPMNLHQAELIRRSIKVEVPPSPLTRQRTHFDNEGNTGDWPMPKWPAGHTSGAFESVAVKKALILSPPETYAEIAHHGEEKAKFHWLKFALLSIAAGCYCGFGFTLCLLVGGNAPKKWLEESPGLFSLLFGAVGFPFSFTLIIVCGAELYTSLCAYMTAAWWERKVKWHDCVRLWVLSWFYNFLGSAIFVGLIYASDIFHHKDWYIKLLVVKKTSLGWGQVVVRGIFANWLVCFATWQANAAQDLTGKAVGIWLPICAFAAMGFEHCVANQFVIPMGIALGAPVSAKAFVWNNLIPATLGNWIGGALCMGTLYAWIYGTPAREFAAWWEGKTAEMAATSVEAEVTTSPLEDLRKSDH